MGYDPYKGVYTAHRPKLLGMKEKALQKLESMGYDSQGRYAAHRPHLMEEKQKAVQRLHASGYDEKGMYSAHRQVTI